MSTTSPIAETPDTNPVAPQARRAALASIANEMRQLKDDELATINMDIATAARMVRACKHGLDTFRPSILKQLPEFDIGRFDRLDTFALAVTQAHLDYVTATEPPEPIEKVLADLTVFRDILLADVAAFAKHGVISDAPVALLRGPRGANNVGYDVSALCTHVRRNWAAIEGKTVLTLAEIERHEELAVQLEAMMGSKERGPIAVSEATDTRRRAFTLFFDTYDQARRAISYLRWDEGDLESIAPSLYQGRGGPRRDNAEPAVVVAPAPVAVAPSTSTSPTTPIVSPTPQPKTPPPGMPGNPPFVS